MAQTWGSIALYEFSLNALLRIEFRRASELGLYLRLRHHLYLSILMPEDVGRSALMRAISLVSRLPMNSLTS